MPSVAVNPPEIVNGHVATRRKGKLYKHCRDCTLLISAHKWKLAKHYQGHHESKEAKFLRPEDVVERTVYSNLPEYWLNQSVELKMYPRARERLSGRPDKWRINEAWMKSLKSVSSSDSPANKNKGLRRRCG